MTGQKKLFLDKFSSENELFGRIIKHEQILLSLLQSDDKEKGLAQAYDYFKAFYCSKPEDKINE